MGKKFFLSMHPRNFVSDKIVRPPLHVNRVEISHFKHLHVWAIFAIYVIKGVNSHS